MAFFSLPGLLPDYEAGQNTGSFVSKVANAAGDFACGLYHDFPGAVVSDTGPNSFGRGLMDSLCNGRQLPPPPTDKPLGGQCPTEYIITGTNTVDGQDFPFATEVLGPIRGITHEAFPPENYGEGAYGVYVYTGDGGKVGLGVVLPSNTNLFNCQVGGTSRKDGLADDCGGGFSWNPSLPTAIPNDRLTGNGNITYNDGTHITVPIVLANFSPIVNIEPKISVNVGGVKVTFDLGGVKVDLGDHNQNPNDPRDRDNNLSDDFDRINKQFDDLRNRLDDTKKAVDNLPKGRNTLPNPDADPELDKKKDDDDSNSSSKTVDKLEWIRIELTQRPTKSQSGNQAPDIFYAGWLEFSTSTGFLPRQPIHFETSLFKAPDGATGYAFTLVNGSKGKATVYTRKVPA